MSRRYGAVIVFPRSFSALDAAQAIEAMRERGLIHNEGPAPAVEVFNDEVEGPVWYLP